ncbi:bifunctional folylpolyglutamate synthase/dihydrofolate synthase [Engelhardtia mirabilis]|uniref:Dihydrofolate synthase/folylpolyglutamate synthase n=1 Tax=Engelhardtia mirabilis TaxID=2528011 RepID=A0A518BSG5_9BACT|nr:Folylpolyglutamate synthase [Planctomycetes bacterium Pla133]QDV04231.1 Folylpolyglutamate synthase [Planctomycetes bacterium Pla86]
MPTPLPSVRAALDALVDWERRDRDAGMRVDVGPMADLCRRLGDPQRDARVVHVAGTKGKGSLCALVDAGLRAAGWRTGRYGSPHVERIEERVCIDGEPVDGADFDASLARSLAAREQALTEGTAATDATWFDVVTATAFDRFRAEGVDWWVVECGLGGRLDSTNVVGGTVCAITSIDLEHTAVLGPTRAAIAGEKAGILKPGARAVAALAEPNGLAGDDPAAVAVAARAAALSVPVRWAPPTAATIGERNRHLAGIVLEELGRAGHRDRAGSRPLGAWALEGVEAPLPGRLERFCFGGVPVVLDGAHVASSLELVADELLADASLPGPAVAVLALGRDKRAEPLLKALARVADRAVCTSAGSGRHLPPEELSQMAAAAGLGVENAPDPRAALHQAASTARGRWVFVVGSLHLAGALRRELAGPTDLRTRC